jgi:hypothetical protein
MGKILNNSSHEIIFFVHLLILCWKVFKSEDILQLLCIYVFREHMLPILHLYRWEIST